MTNKKTIQKIIGIIFATIGIGLFALNLVGLFQSPLNFEDEKGVFKNDVWYTYQDFISQKEKLERDKITDSLVFVKSMMDLVSGRFLHKWDFQDHELLNYHITIPPSENYILYLLSFFDKRYKQYFFSSVDRAVRRGIGQCAQQSEVLSGILRHNGFDAYTIGLNGHVLVGVQIEKKEILLDPDYNILTPYSLNKAEEQPSIIFSSYQDIDANYSDPGTYRISTADMVKLFETKDNWKSTEKTVTVGWKYKFLETISYVFKWLLPAMLVWSAGNIFYAKKN